MREVRINISIQRCCKVANRLLQRTKKKEASLITSGPIFAGLLHEGGHGF